MSADASSLILIVDDDPGIVTLQKRRLERAGFRVDAAEGIEDALAILASGNVALVLLDYRLGQTTGLELHRRMNARGLHTPVILVSGALDDSTVADAMRAGIRDVVVKTTDYLDHLPEAVRGVLDQTSAPHTPQLKRAGTCILILEDDAGVATLQRRQLERAGHSVKLTTTAEDAARIVREGDVSLAIFDLRLPGGASGLELYEQLKAEGLDFPAILVTGFPDQDVAIRALRAGIRDFVPKSSDYLSYLPTAVDRVIAQLRVERKLKDSELRLASIIGSTMDAVLMCDEGSRIVLFNRAAEAMFGCVAADALTQPLSTFLPGLSLGQPASQHETLRERRELGGRRLSGSAVPLEVSITEVVIDEERHFTIIARDLSERRAAERARAEREAEGLQLQSRLAQVHKLEAIGHLAGGVAHDFNNLLTAILGFSELAAEDYAPDEPRSQNLDEIRKAAERAKALTQQLLAFSRRQILQPTVLDMNSVVTDTLRLLQRLIGEQIDLRLSLHSGSLNVKADRTQLEQILMNLVVNARDAMPNGGALTVETTAVVLDESYGRQHGVVTIEPGPHVLLEVSDSGIGMDAETKRRLFEPFFTTKLIGHGTGLGLATVYGIIKQSDGFVWVYSELGKGTTFKVYLPRINTPLAEQCERRPVAAPSRGGSETLLLVEDEEAVRRLARTLFERNGYRVLEAPNPTVAETLCTDEPARIDLMVTDVVMPGMSGPELFRRLQALRPSMKVLYMSGYAAEAIVHRGVLDPGVAFIQKPFTLAGLMEKVREVLNAARPTLLESHRSLAPSRSRHTRH